MNGQKMVQVYNEILFSFKKKLTHAVYMDEP